MNDPRGSLWRKWDLHVHTPESLVHQYDGVDPWPQFLTEIESLPAEFKVIGINDYIFLDGYRRILAENAGRLQNIDLFLPVIELRLDKFGGSSHYLRRVNYHILFSDELSPDVIEQQFLNALSSKYTLTPQYDQIRSSGKWKALPTRQSLVDLGQMIIDSVPPEQKSHFGTPLIEGFNNLAVSLAAVCEALESHYFKNKFLTAVGKTEWADIKWNDHSIADKKNIINGADFVFTAADTVQQWEKAKQSLRGAGVNDRLLDCSDAHSFLSSPNKDRLGHCFTWIKADPTFAGLRQLLVEPDERIWVGDMPPQLARVRNNPTKYIQTIEIRRKPTATMGEVWFNNSIPVNPGLVAIIGNKGKGKSALTDIIGLLSSTQQHGDFTFLSAENFRQPKDNKAKHFQATMTLESGTPITRGLEEIVDERQPELVKYIPQNFLEKICTQLGKIEESHFDRELKKVIFSHVEPPYRLGQASLDGLIAFKTTEATQKSDILKQEMRRINEEIIGLEERAQPAHRKEIENLLNKKRKELIAHHTAKPAVVSKPENDPTRQKEIIETNTAIDAAKAELLAEEAKITTATTQRGASAQQMATVVRITGRLDNLNRQFQGFVRDSQNDCVGLGLAVEQILQATINKGPLLEKRQSILDEQREIDLGLDPANTDGFLHRKARIEARIRELQNALDEPNRRFQTYQTALKAWDTNRLAIIGDKDTPDTVAYYEAQLADLDAIPAQLTDAGNRRLVKSKEIHEVIRQLAETYRELYAPVNKFIETTALAREKFHRNFEVGIVDAGFLDEFFELISQGVAGTFCGVEPGTKLLKELLGQQDFNTESGIEMFLNEMVDALQRDRRPGGKALKVGDQLRKGKTVLALYDFIFSLSYLRPRYALRMGAKELSELSPGERGTLLLVFYLLVDNDDIPLVIDQPEENLDNQTVYELLVPCMKEAKRRRQLFMVTHNPNLAVVCDAEQIICADLDKINNHTMRYLSGAIEDPQINRAIVDILEGTMPAFHNRQDKYFIPAS
ncbi:MAG: TrlF family AAA-like ATPase [Bryobacteraceae bacterium]